MIGRRTLLAAAGAALLRPAIAQPSSVLRFVPQANLTSLDPVWTTASVTRNHAFLVYDTLYGLDAAYQPRPQMAEGHVFDDDGRICTITLREGLRFHDGEPVRAADAVASLLRWMKRNAAGQYLAANLEQAAALDDRRLQLRLKRRQPTLIGSLASATSPVLFVMPERIARTDPFSQIQETVGSGPYRFRPDEYVSGSRCVYQRNTAYVPSPDAGRGMTAGPKLAYFDRVEWLIIPEAATAAAALRTGEVHWFEQPPAEIATALRADRNVVVQSMDSRPLPGVLRLNHLHPPFDNKAVRRALLPAIDQHDFMAAVVGDDPQAIDAECGVFTPGTTLASRTGLEPLLGPRSLDRARALLKEAGYAGEPTRILVPTDILAPSAIAQVAADLFKRLGLNVDPVLTDWGTVIQRRASRQPVEKGGWSAITTAVNAPDFVDPSVHFALRGNGEAAWFGWPTSPLLETLRDEWLSTSDPDAQFRLAGDIQRAVMDEVPYIPVGAYRSATAFRASLRDRIIGFPIFWGIRAT